MQFTFRKLIVLSIVILILLTGCKNQDSDASVSRESEPRTSSQESESSTSQHTTAPHPEETTTEPQSTITSTEPDEQQSDAEEPSSPLRQLRFFQAEQGLVGRKAETFFNQLQSSPLYYAYELHDLEKGENATVVIAIDQEHRLYTRYEISGQKIEIISPTSGQYYLIDQVDKTFLQAENLGVETYLLTPEKILTLFDEANRLYFIGEGNASFDGKNSIFEEYTKDNRSFYRYYFASEKPLGHRVFSQTGELQKEVIIDQLINEITDQDVLFELPPDYVETPVS